MIFFMVSPLDYTNIHFNTSIKGSRQRSRGNSTLPDSNSTLVSCETAGRFVVDGVNDDCSHPYVMTDQFPKYPNYDTSL
jgi:hypothetical protein